MIIDTRNKSKGRTVVPNGAAAVAQARLESLKHTAATPQKAKKAAPSPDRIVPPVEFDHAPPPPLKYVPLTARPAADPRTWDAYSKDVDISISGLGSTRRYKRYPNHSFSMAAAIWTDSPAESDAAAKAGLKAKANEHKSASGAATSL